MAAATPAKKKTTKPKASASKAAEQAVALKISPIGDFKKRLGGIMELPSGLVVRTHNPGGLNAFLGGGSIPNALMGSVTEAMERAENGEKTEDLVNEESIAKMIKENPDAILEMQNMMDEVALRVITEPTVHPIPEPGVERDDNTLYVDEVPSVDKQFLFKWVTSGVDDLKPFRK